MLLKGNVTIRAQGKEVGNYLADPNQIGQCIPMAVMIETVEAQRKRNQASAEKEVAIQSFKGTRQSYIHETCSL